MNDRYARLKMLIGGEPFEKLRNARVAVFGVGGVGGYAAEALARSGIGHLDLIDHDTVSFSNINRQIIALESTVGMAKTEVMKQRICDIDPAIEVRTFPLFYLPDTKDTFDFREYDYIVDAIDTVTAKIDLILSAQEAGTPVISSMGCGNRLDPSKLIVTDIYETKNDPLAKVMRRELRKRGVKKLKVVLSTETPIKPLFNAQEAENSGKRSVPGSSAFVPPAGGLLIASCVVRDLLQ